MIRGHLIARRSLSRVFSHDPLASASACGLRLARYASQQSPRPKQQHPSFQKKSTGASHTPHPGLADLRRPLRSAGSLLKATSTADAVALHFGNVDQPVLLSTLWLRDSCQCQSCVSPSSGQKRFATTQVPASPQVRHVSVRDDGGLAVEWTADFFTGGDHTSTYSRDFLLQQLRPGREPTLNLTRRFWDRRRFAEQLRPIPYSDWMGNDEHFWRGLTDLYQTGLIVLEHVPDSETAVVDIANRIGHVQSTFYGPTWDVVSKPQAENVAYTNEFLGLHQDLMYYRDSPKIQLLHCLKNECDGGESLFSDGAKAAIEMELRHPVFHERLRRFKVPYAYDRNGHFYRRRRPVVPNNNVTSREVAWSPPFQGVFHPPYLDPARNDRAGPADPLSKWREAAAVFDSIINAPENVFERRFKPGDCVLFDNMRVMHGRRQFNTATGHRWLKGTYIGAQEFESKVRQIPAEFDPPTPPGYVLPDSDWAQVRDLVGLSGGGDE